MRRKLPIIPLYSVVGIILIASIIFLCFQMFSFGVLNLHKKATEDMQVFNGVKENIKIIKESDKKFIDEDTIDDCGQKNSFPCITKKKLKDEINPKFRWIEEENKMIEDESLQGGKKKVAIINLPFGVPLSLRSQYMPNSNLFTCLHSKERIPYSYVNDDYCDCADSSDEPGTSACPEAKFYCKFQIPGSQPVWLWSSKVNDGVCDCCDGSDEWMAMHLPADSKVIEEVRKEIQGVQKPCTNQCSEVYEQQLGEIEKIKKGQKLQKSYIEAAKVIENPGDLYGPNGVFYKLSLSCFDLNNGKYTYSVCPFKKVSQIDSGHITVIGRYPSWNIHKDHKFQLKMSNGDSVRCPEQRHRHTLINFMCGLENKVLHLQESEICRYVIKFETPAAC